MTEKITGFMTAGLFLILISATAYGATATQTMQVTGTVTSSITVTTTPIDLGSMAQGGASGNATGTISVQAASGATYTIAIDGGLHYSTTSLSRQISLDATNALTYVLLQPDFMTNWGDGGTTIGDPIYPSTGTLPADGTVQIYTVYASTQAIPATATPGTYTDTVTVTVTY